MPTLYGLDLDCTSEKETAMYIDHVGINTNDMEAKLQFYCGILGMRLVRTTRTPDGDGDRLAAAARETWDAYQAL